MTSCPSTHVIHGPGEKHRAAEAVFSRIAAEDRRLDGSLFFLREEVLLIAENAVKCRHDGVRMRKRRVKKGRIIGVADVAVRQGPRHFHAETRAVARRHRKGAREA